MREIEEWRDIEGYEGLYQVSNKGRVRSFYYSTEGKILKQSKDKDGYNCIGLHKNKITKYCKVHRLVANAFLQNPNNLPEIKHKDECKTNNSVENIEWCDRKHNVTWNDLHKRSGYKNRNNILSKKVCQLTKEGDLIAIYSSTREAERNGFNHCNISMCCNGLSYTHKGFKWKYYD